MPNQLIDVTISANSIKGLKADQLALMKIKNALENREAVMQQIKGHMIERWATNLTSEGAIYGKWKSLSNTWTIPDRLDKGFGAGPILVRSGRLFTSFMNANKAGEITNQAVTWNFTNTGGHGSETGEGWFVAHHLGYPNPLPNHGPIPPRILWDVNADDEAAIQEILDNYVTEVVNKYLPPTF